MLPPQTKAKTALAVAAASACCVAEVGELVFGERLEPRARQMSAPRVADQRADAGQAAAVEKRGRARRQTRLVEQVADQHEVDVGRRLVERIGAQRGDRNRVGLGVQRDREIASGSTSIAKASRAPAFIAAIATSPPPAPRSSTRFSATVSGWSMR